MNKISKPYKSIFPMKLGCGFRLSIVDNHVIIEERGIFLFWRWKVIIRHPLDAPDGKDIRQLAKKYLDNPA